jgi:hypothetical protein
MSRVASAASPALSTAVCKSDGFADNALANAVRGSISVRDGGRARVYVYNCPRAAETARDQSCSAATSTPEAESAWARAEKKILVVSVDTIDVKEVYGENSRVQCTAGATHFLGRHFRYSDEGTDNILAADRARVETCEHS